MRYFFHVRYLGSNYHGWQIQDNAVTVQEVINDVLSTLQGQPMETTGSGRTDTGVHASQQVFHADFEQPIEPTDFKYKLNSFLPRDISIVSIRQVQDVAGARFNAISRSYVYKIHLQKDPFLQKLSYYFRQDLNVEAMNQSAQYLLQYEDFESFSKVKTSVNHFRCRLTLAHWEDYGHQLFFNISGNRFLRGMVRAIVGTLLDVGVGKSDPETVKSIIEAKDRKRAGRSVPAQGLYLCGVEYPADIYKQ